jgi:cell division protein FtsW (lipid II flippase)
MKNVANIAMILALIPAVLRIAFEKQIGPEQAALVLIVGVFFIAGGKPFVRLVAGVAGLYLFSWEITGGVGEELISDNCCS